ncbi:MAG: DUF58 domain-containing protein [Aeromonadaceae bacterium]|nr:DUF58 domain-containing protein [Aeromonadaceae bacterium]
MAPRPVPCALPLTGLAGQGQHAQQALHAPPEELAELRPYRPGEPLSRLAWRQLAQGRGKLTKVFDAPQGRPNGWIWTRHPARIWTCVWASCAIRCCS